MSAGGTSYGSVLRDRDFRALLVLDGLSVVGDQVARIAVALLVLRQTDSAFLASATYALSYLTWMLAGPLLSALPDRYPRRRVMIACDLLRAVLVAALAFPGLPLWAVFALLTLAGAIAPANDAARSALLADLLTGERYVVGNALANAVAQGGQALGFLAGAGLAAGVGVGGALLVDAASFALSGLLLLLLVREQPFERLASATSALGEAAAGVRLVMGDPRLRALLGWGLLAACSVIATEGLAVAVVAERGGGTVLVGVLTAAVPIGYLLGSAVLLRVAVERREGLFPVMVAASCLLLALSPLVAEPRLLVALWVLAGVGNALQLVANAAFVQAVPSHLRGRAFGFAGGALFAVQGLVLVAAGALADVVGAREAVAAVAVVCLLLVPVLRGSSVRAQGRPSVGRGSAG